MIVSRRLQTDLGMVTGLAARWTGQEEGEAGPPTT